MKSSVKDVEEWLNVIKQEGFKSFKFKDLPENIRDKNILWKAKSLGLIRKTRISREQVVIWEISIPSKDRIKKSTNVRRSRVR